MEIINSAIKKYSTIRKKKLLSVHFKNKYAFVGIGNHSINNLYPVLNYLHVPIKYIITHTEETAETINQSDWNIQATNNYDVALNDPEIAGIIISASPNSHFKLAKKALEHNKNVFVEKPPCNIINELKELIEIEKKSQGTVLCGLQKRYTPAYNILKKEMKGIQHYSLRYCTGAYPEGDEIMDLYIHPMDIVYYLFGEGEIKSILNSASTIFIQTKHKNGIIGTLELSTGYSWETAIESLTVNTRKRIYELNTTAELLYKSKPEIIKNIPLEKVFKYTPEIKVLFNQNSFLPVLQHNNLYTHGFYSELESFINICENGNLKQNKSDLNSIVPTYLFLDEVKKRKSS